MERILSGKQMKEVDLYTINTIGVPSMVMMERAAMEIVLLIESIAKIEDRILVVAGTGNNGADAIAVFRILMSKGYRVECAVVGDLHKTSHEFKSQLGIIKNSGYKYLSASEDESLDVDYKNYNIIVDGIFGIGLSRDIDGVYRDVIEKINQAKSEENHIKIVAIDIPSGINADDAKKMGAAIMADYTVSFAKPKLGNIMYPGASYCGKVIVCDIGIPFRVYGKVLFSNRTNNYITEEINAFEKADIKDYLAPRSPYSHKGTYGKVLVIAGSKEYSGAAYLCESAAYKSGCGLVKVITSIENKGMLTVMVPEGLYVFYDDNGISDEQLLEEIAWADAIVIGPGLGKSDIALNILKTVLLEKEKPIIIDADGINLISENRELLEEIDNNMVLTPHLKEMAGLMDMSVSEVKNDMLYAVSAYKRNHRGTIVLKDARTIIAGPKKELSINTSGNSGMASGGSGDVLAGILGGLIAQEPNFDIALKSMAGVYLHGLAGDKAAESLGEYAMTASDIVAALSDVLKEYEKY
jgi:NAD(P)H-hydrate epimerase